MRRLSHLTVFLCSVHGLSTSSLPVKKNNDDRSELQEWVKAEKWKVCAAFLPGEESKRERERAALCLQASEVPEHNPK